jgi:hypothetical protein
MEEIKVWRTAKILIDSYGDEAWLEAAQRTDYALAECKLEVAAVWTRVWKAIQALQQRKPNGSGSFHQPFWCAASRD